MPQAAQNAILALPCETRAVTRQATRVLLIAPYAPRGGGMGRIMEYLAQAGCPGIAFDRVESRGSGAGAASIMPALAAAARILAAAARAAPAIVHVNMADGASVFRKGALLLLARALGMPAILHLHAADLFGYYDGLNPLARQFVRRIFRAASVCIVLGEPWREFLTLRLGVAPARIEILRNGVPAPQRCFTAAPRKTFRFVFIGNLLARKGLRDLLHACADPRLAGLDWDLVVAGGGDAASFARLALLHNITARVRFTGWLDRADVTALLSHADALVLPSTHEALPLVLAEAAGLAVPVIATPVGAIAEVFSDGDTALFVPPNDPAALAAAMLRLTTEPGLAARLRHGGRALYEAEFTMQRFTAGLAAIYARHAAPR